MAYKQEYNLDNIGNADILSLLKWYQEAGVDETIGDETIDWFALTSEAPLQKTPTLEIKSPASKHRPHRPMVSVDQITKDAEQLAASCGSLSDLNAAIKGFDGCSLKKTAANTVFSDGNPNSPIMVIGEAPGVDEDRQGKPFAGESGQLLNRMFKAIDLDRSTDFYVTNILPWRPPGNRKPTPEEIAICMPFITRHIELFDPELIILLGGISANSLLKSTLGITRLRGKWMDYDLKGKPIPVRSLFHPDYLLKQPKAKGDTWRDLLEIKAKIGEISV